MHISGIDKTAVSLSGIVDILNNNESNNMDFSANASTFHIPALLRAKYRYISLKYELFKYPA